MKWSMPLRLPGKATLVEPDRWVGFALFEVINSLPSASRIAYQGMPPFRLSGYRRGGFPRGSRD